jgi:hypothetical protein
MQKFYEQAFDLGLKGFTIFRDGSKDPALQVGTKAQTRPESKEQSVANTAQSDYKTASKCNDTKTEADAVRGFIIRLKQIRVLCL